MRLFEYIHDKDWLLEKLKHYYETMGFFVKTIDDGDTPPALSVCENETHEFEYTANVTGMWLYFYPLYHAAKDETDLRFRVHINCIVLARKDRGKGIAAKMIDGLIKIFGDDLYEIELQDESHGFWEHMKKLYPKVRFNFED